MQTHVYTMKTSDNIILMALITARTPMLAKKILDADFRKAYGQDYNYEITAEYAAKKTEHLEDHLHHHLSKDRHYVYIYNNTDSSNCHLFKVDEAPALISISKADHHYPVYVLLDDPTPPF